LRAEHAEKLCASCIRAEEQDNTKAAGAFKTDEMSDGKTGTDSSAPPYLVASQVTGSVCGDRDSILGQEYGGDKNRFHHQLRVTSRSWNLNWPRLSEQVSVLQSIWSMMRTAPGLERSLVHQLDMFAVGELHMQHEKAIVTVLSQSSALQMRK
jgi:hypothetical protein